MTSDHLQVEREANAQRPESACYACVSANGLSMMRAVRDCHNASGRFFDLVTCNACGSAHLATALSPEDLGQFYTSAYYDRSGEPLYLRALRYLSGFLHDRHRFKPTFTSLLEIGCGPGRFLSTLRRRGSVVGLERSELARELGAQRGVEIVVGDVNDKGTFGENQFDYVYLNHSFEHLPDPNAALESIRRWLKPQGKLFIAIPNFSGLVARVFGRNWYHLCPPLHITCSTVAGITALLERHGFRVEKVGYNSDPLSIPMSLYFAMGGGIPGMRLSTKLLLAGIDVLVKPLVWLFDALHAGDCIEVHAVLKPPARQA